MKFFTSILRRLANAERGAEVEWPPATFIARKAASLNSCVPCDSFSPCHFIGLWSSFSLKENNVGIAFSFRCSFFGIKSGRLSFEIITRFSRKHSSSKWTEHTLLFWQGFQSLLLILRHHSLFSFLVFCIWELSTTPLSPDYNFKFGALGLELRTTNMTSQIQLWLRGAKTLTERFPKIRV